MLDLLIIRPCFAYQPLLILLSLLGVTFPMSVKIPSFKAESDVVLSLLALVAETAWSQSSGPAGFLTVGEKL